jgi:hypothetical protein
LEALPVSERCSTVGHLETLAAQGRPLPKAWIEASERARKRIADSGLVRAMEDARRASEAWAAEIERARACVRRGSAAMQHQVARLCRKMDLSEDASVHAFCHAAVGTAIAVWHQPLDTAWHMTMDEYEAAFLARERERREFAAAMRIAPAPEQRARPGRPPRPFLAKLAASGAAWLAANGEPDNQADLVRAMEAECDRCGWNYGDTQMREFAADLIANFRAALAE